MMPGMDPFAPEDARVAALRDLLPATGAGIYLDTATAGPLPAESDRALRESDDWELRVGRAGPGRDEDLRQRAQEAQAVVAAVLGADPKRVLLAGGGAAALGAFVAGAARPIRRITAIEGLPGPLLAMLRALAVAPGRAATPLSEASLGSPISAGTDLVVIPHADAGTGALLPLDALVGAARGAGALVVVDASRTAGAIAMTLRELDADGVLVDGHRWLLGPDGVTALWLGQAIAPATLAPLLDLPPRRVLLGLARSVGWLLMYGGLPWLLERTERLARVLATDLAATHGVEVITPADATGAIVAFRIGGWSADEAADELGRRVFAIVGRHAPAAPEPGHVIASVGAWNTEAELHRFVGAVDQLARATPETLPHRPALVMLGDDAGGPPG